MLLAILSDSHDHIPNLVRAVHRANRAGAGMLLHCGDLISPFMLPYLERFAGHIHLIYGNNAGDRHLISSRCAAPDSRIIHHGVQGDIEADGLRIGLNHYPELARGMAASGEYDLVCCGHNHRAGVESIGKCLLVNPGDLLGKEDPPGFILLDSRTLDWERVEVGDRLVIDPEPALSPNPNPCTGP